MAVITARKIDPPRAVTRYVRTPNPRRSSSGRAARRRATLGLQEKTADRAVEILGTALAGGGRLTRAECLVALNEGSPALDSRRP